MTETTGAAAPLRIVAIAGSLRHGSWNRRLLEAAQALAPSGVRIDIVDLADVPLYDGDQDTDETRPAAVGRLKQLVADADGVLFSTPEFNHSVPGVLQNAIDWVSRPAMRSPLAGKPVAIMGASPGALGAARAQQQLKLVLMSTLAHVLPHPGVSVAMVAEKFDAAGELVHEPTRQFLAAFLAQFSTWIRQVGRPASAAA
ncbi:NADPH-dependent FMN reductase [Gemmatirosa kalamazoonensis]|uniref:NADPH-dependent FMN reductase n=1 Tax=Gemmatirosa kalamazoonensis TaxID=861299 RepID=W0RC00_9BACT|nr:NAD(P)H-dependent oxidoreductase [Gemmatirosa kalamazoonensis]AHG88306.1 NADPH-dependent FMN reductase [Gemmatirosa kalamazoonensis]